jgi:DNA modification methylase
VLPLAALTRDAQNPRRRTDRGAQAIADSLKAFGAARSIVIDETNTILAGNGVIDAAALAGLARVQVVDAAGDAVIAVRRRNLTPAQKRALTIADNRTSELAVWDADAVRAAQLEGVDLAQFWSAVELHQLIGDGALKPGRTAPDTVPARRTTTITRGDLFTLGPHRLLCGDSTDRGAVARALERPADFCFTSPPYSNLRQYGGDVDLSVAHLAEFLAAAADRVTLFAVNLGLVRKDNAVVPYWNSYLEVAARHALKLLSWNVWYQGAQGSVGKLSAMFPIEHEFIFVLGRDKHRIARTVANKAAGHVRPPGDRQADGSVQQRRSVVVASHRPLGTVIQLPPEVTREPGVKDHPARFPVALAVAYARACTPAGGVLFDPFAGSGTTLIAAEQLGLACAAIEIDPGYCQMTIDRWEAFTGARAEKVRAA